MKAKTTLLKLSMVALFLFTSSIAWAQATPDRYYICANSTLSLAVQAPTSIPDITFSWDVFQGSTSIGNGYPTAASANANANAPTGLPATPGVYTIKLNSVSTNPNVCAPDVVEYEVIVLPTLASTASASQTTYCSDATGAGAILSSVISQSVTGLPATAPYSTDLELEYSYSVVKGTDAAVDGVIGGFGTISNGAFTLSTTDAAVYKITGTVKYKQKAGNTGVLLSTAGCPVSATEVTVTVTDKPAKPTIVITAN